MILLPHLLISGKQTLKNMYKEIEADARGRNIYKIVADKIHENSGFWKRKLSRRQLERLLRDLTELKKKTEGTNRTDK